MNDIDRAAEPLIQACAMLGAPRTFDPSEQETLARWIALVTFLFEQTIEAPITPPERLAEFSQTRNPPSGMHAALAVAEAPPGNFHLGGWVNVVHLESPRYVGDGHFCTFRIQYLVARAFIPPAHLAAALRGPEADFIVPVWPPSEEASWPPPKVIAHHQIETFATAYIGSDSESPE